MLKHGCSRHLLSYMVPRQILPGKPMASTVSKYVKSDFCSVIQFTTRWIKKLQILIVQKNMFSGQKRKQGPLPPPKQI